jgi:phosphoribosylcarboxyaminoimidazole (NCAIR) mutase
LIPLGTVKFPDELKVRVQNALAPEPDLVRVNPLPSTLQTSEVTAFAPCGIETATAVIATAANATATNLRLLLLEDLKLSSQLTVI